MFTEVDDQFFLQSLVSSYFEPLESLSEVIMLVFVYLIAIFLLLFERY